jgi:predicted TIM-barrel fold metal-dependent hydrolase
MTERESLAIRELSETEVEIRELRTKLQQENRLDTHARAAAERRGLKKAPIDYFRDNLVVTTSGNWYEPAFVCTLLAMGIDNMLFAIDWPYESNKVGMEFFNKLSLNDMDKHKLAHGNAEKLLRI